MTLGFIIIGTFFTIIIIELIVVFRYIYLLRKDRLHDELENAFDILVDEYLESNQWYMRRKYDVPKNNMGKHNA